MVGVYPSGTVGVYSSGTVGVYPTGKNHLLETETVKTADSTGPPSEIRPGECHYLPKI